MKCYECEKEVSGIWNGKYGGPDPFDGVSHPLCFYHWVTPTGFIGAALIGLALLCVLGIVLWEKL